MGDDLKARRPLKINFILPFVSSRPGGGIKIMYEYANRLSAKGHQVIIIHSIKRGDKKVKSPIWYKKLIYTIRNSAYPKWFKFEKGVTSIIVNELTDKYLPDADISISTWWSAAMQIAQASPSKGVKFNLIQDYETWTGQKEKTHQSYKLPIHHLVIAKYLGELVKKISGIEPVHIPNAIDTNKYRIMNPPELRKPASVCMLYSTEKRKGSAFGLTALKAVKNKVPSLTVDLFGVAEKPHDLPVWITYHYRRHDLNEIYNRNSIFISPSLGEGWALPPAEAMACGCAVICTDIGGHHDYAISENTALLVPVENSDAIENLILKLINDHTFRIEMAERAHAFITGTFSWESSVNKMEDEFYRHI